MGRFLLLLRRDKRTIVPSPVNPPPDLKHCNDCGKVIGPLKGWFGAECQCGQERGDALRGAHSIRPNPPR